MRKFALKLVIFQMFFLLMTSFAYATNHKGQLPPVDGGAEIDKIESDAAMSKAKDDAGKDELIPSGTVLPETSGSMEECETISRYVNLHSGEVKNAIGARESIAVPGAFIVKPNDFLGCAIKTGDIKLWMIAFYIRYLLEFVIGLVGLISVGGVIYGGYFYLFSGITEDKEKGKNAIKNAIIGIVLSLSAWAIVNIVMALVTG